MPINNFKPFAIGTGANVTPQSDWETLSALGNGFSSGKASSAQVNKAIRQASFIAAAVAQFTSDTTGQDVLDDGNLAGFLTKFKEGFSGRLLTAKRYNSSGNYTPSSPLVTKVKIIMVGAGGGGGGCAAVNTGQTVSGAGGGGAGMVMAVVPVTFGVMYPMVIPTGGIGAAGPGSGGAGGTSTMFGFSASGGQGGVWSSSTSTAGGLPGAGSGAGAQYIEYGGHGSDGQAGTLIFAGNGGGSYWGGGGRAAGGSVTTSRAAGAGGGGTYDSSLSGTIYPGSNGGNGSIYLEEYS